MLPLLRFPGSGWWKAILLGVLLTSLGGAADPPEWLEPYPPFKIAGNLYWVGSKDLASYLIATPQGCILINSSLQPSVPLIQASVEQLGFKFSDIKILLISHAHWDHDAGSARIKELTGAAYMVMEPDVPVVESGGRADFHYGSFPGSLYPPAKVDRVLHDGDEVKLGDTILVAHLTAGHTPGCTTWTMKVTEGDRTYNAVIVGSPNVNEGFDLVANKRYPQIADDYARGFAVLKSLPCDLFLGAHGAYFGMLAKRAQLKPGAANPFVDPEGYRSFVAEREQAFRAELAKQQAAVFAGLAKQGRLIVAPFASAPFPHPARAEGHTYEGKRYTAAEHYSDSTVAIFIPPGFRETDSIDFVVHFHGWRNTVAGTLATFHLAEQLVASGKNAILVVPEGPRDAPDSFGGKLEDAGGFQRFMDEVVATLRARAGFKRSDFSVGRIILSGHSGGYHVMAGILDRGGLDRNIAEVWLFDALYGQTGSFVAWAQRSPGRLIDLYTDHGGTKEETEKLITHLRAEDTTILQTEEAQLDASTLAGRHYVFIHTDLTHNEVLDKRGQFTRFLQTSPLAER